MEFTFFYFILNVEKIQGKSQDKNTFSNSTCSYYSFMFTDPSDAAFLCYFLYVTFTFNKRHNQSGLYHGMTLQITVNGVQASKTQAREEGESLQ